MKSFKPIRMTASAVQGRGHERAGVACQDFALNSRGKRVSVIVLCDGASSASHAQQGARLVGTVAAKFLRTKFSALTELNESDVAQILIARLHRELSVFAQEADIPVSQLACTLLFVATDGKRVLCGQLGDGRMALFNQDLSEVQPVFQVQKGEFLNETFFVTSRNATEMLQIRCIPIAGLGGFAIMSDGAEQSLYNRAHGVFAAGLSKMIGWLDHHPEKKIQRAITENLATALRERTHDDLGLALMRFCPSSDS